MLLSSRSFVFIIIILYILYIVSLVHVWIYLIVFGCYYVSGIYPACYYIVTYLNLVSLVERSQDSHQAKANDLTVRVTIKMIIIQT